MWRFLFVLLVSILPVSALAAGWPAVNTTLDSAIAATGVAKNDLSNAMLPASIDNMGLFRTAKSYGFVGDAQVISGITTTANSTAFGGWTAPASAIGKTIIVPGAGVPAGQLITTIADTTHFAAPAGTGTNSSTYFAPMGRTCPVATGTNGTASYAPGDTITLNDGGSPHAICTVQYTKVATAAVVAGGSCPGVGSTWLKTTTGTSSTGAIINGHCNGTTIDSITSIIWGGRFESNPANLADEPVTCYTVSPCSGIQLSLVMGVGIARVTQQGRITPVPSDPIGQLSSSGSGAGATFNMSSLPSSAGTTDKVWVAGGTAIYGTLNTTTSTCPTPGPSCSMAMSNLMADTTSPTVTFPAGNYLVAGAGYAPASSLSIVGADAGKTVLMMEPYAQLGNNFLQWTNKSGVSIRNITLDANWDFNNSTVGENIKSLIEFQGGNNINVENISIIHQNPLFLGLDFDSSTTQGITNGHINNIYINETYPDTTATRSVFVTDTNQQGMNVNVDHIESIGAGARFCMDGGTVGNSQSSHWSYGSGFSTAPGNPKCGNVRFLNIAAHDGMPSLDVDNTPTSGIEMDDDGDQLIGGRFWMNGGDGVRCNSKDAFIRDIRSWDNGNKFINFSTDSAGVRAGTYPGKPDGCSGATIDNIVSFDDRGGSATQGYGYIEDNNGGNYPTGVNVGPSHVFSGNVIAPQFVGSAATTWVGSWIGTPTISACGTGASVAGTNSAGTITFGTGTPTSCTLTFSPAWAATPICTVSWRASLASTGYTPAATTLTLTQTATDNDVVDYWCVAN